MFLEFPTEQNWVELEKKYPFNDLVVATQAFADAWPSDNSMEGFTDSIEVHDWSQHLHTRLNQTCISYVMLMFYYSKGIPDDPWYISPGRGGESVQYFPNFEEKHFWYKSQFNYYADIFYYKAFSVWDTIGHLLNTVYNLEIKKASFSLAHKNLALPKPELYDKLKQEVVDSPIFKQARDFRHDITHNFLPGQVGNTITRATYNHGRSISYGVGKYTSVSEIADNATKTLTLVTETMRVIADDALVADNAALTGTAH